MPPPYCRLTDPGESSSQVQPPPYYPPSGPSESSSQVQPQAYYPPPGPVESSSQVQPPPYYPPTGPGEPPSEVQPPPYYPPSGHYNSSFQEQPPPYYPPSDSGTSSQAQQPFHLENSTNSDRSHAVFVVLQRPQIVQEQETAPSDHLCWSTICCLVLVWPIGVYAVVASVKARSAAKRGDIRSARTNSKIACGLNISNAIVITAILICIAVVYIP